MKLIVNPEGVIRGAFEQVEVFEDRLSAGGSHYAIQHQVIEIAELPTDFDCEKYQWDGSALVRLPAPVEEQPAE